MFLPGRVVHVPESIAYSIWVPSALSCDMFYASAYSRSNLRSLTEQKACALRKVVKCVSPKGFLSNRGKMLFFLFALFFDGDMKEKRHEPHVCSMHPLFNQPLSRIRATAHGLATDRNPAAQRSEAYSTFKALNLKKKKKKSFLNKPPPPKKTPSRPQPQPIRAV